MVEALEFDTLVHRVLIEGHHIPIRADANEKLLVHLAQHAELFHHVFGQLDVVK